ncbi:MAG: HEAT repeat domain-containing protein [Planctomycetes bacterium]|nr:HEAT repeat domain-containing protein [Planctomycetota bacterium]
MKRLVGPILGLAAGVLLAGTAFAKMDDKEWAAVKGELTAKANSPEASVRASIIGRLADADRKEAALLLLGILDAVDKDAITQEDERDKILGKIEKQGLVRPTEMKAASAYDEEMKRLSGARKVADEKLAKDRDLHFQLIEALAKVQDAEAVKWLATNGLKNGQWTNRAGVAEVFGYVKNADATQGLLDLYPREPDARVRLAILDSLARLSEARGAPHMIKGLTDESWQVRAAAAEGIAKLKVKEGVEPLINALEKEQGARPRANLMEALAALTGESWGADVATWKKWWKDNKDTWAGPKERPVAATGGGAAGGTHVSNDFFGIPIDSDRIVFILDISGSMDEEYEIKGKQQVVSGGDGKADKGPEPFKGSKLKAAKLELIKCLKKLDPKVSFNIIFFNSSVEKWKDGLLLASPANKEEAIKYVDRQTASNQTNIWDALELAFKMAGMGLNDKQYKAGIDTIYLLSDGAPWPAELFIQRDEILKREREQNKLKKVRIHTIAFGDGADTSLMEALARDTGGKYVKK